MKIIIALISAISITVSGAAEDAGDSWTLDQVMRELANIELIESDFVETRNSAFLVEPLKLRGMITFRSPQTLIKETRTPYAERVTVEDVGVTIERLEGKNAEASKRYISADEHPVVKGLIEGVRATMAGERHSLEEQYSIEMYGKKDDWRIQLLPKEKILQDKITSISIEGHAEIIDSIETQEADGDWSIINLTYRKVEK